MVGLWSIARRFLATAAAACGIVVLVACRPTAPASQIGDIPSITPESPTTSQVLPKETPSAVADTAPEAFPSTDQTEERVDTMRATPIATTPAASEAERMVAQVKADLVRRLGIAEQDIAFQYIEQVQWSNASLGCPNPGVMYAQVLTPGYRVVLEARGETYEYHTDKRQSVILCERSTTEPPTGQSEVEPGLEQMVGQAKQDLAQRLSLPANQIEVLEARLVLWPDASRGCPQPGMRYRQVPEEGVLIRLSAGGRVYDYHSGGKDGLFLCEQRLRVPELTPKPGSHEQLPPPSSLDD